MTIEQSSTGVASLVPANEFTVHSSVGAGGFVLLLNIRDMAATNELLMRHYVTFDIDGNTIIGSKTIEHGVTTDEQWAAGAVAGDANAEGWTSWPLGMGDSGGFVSIESISGSYDIEYVVLSLGGTV